MLQEIHETPEQVAVCPSYNGLSTVNMSVQMPICKAPTSELAQVTFTFIEKQRYGDMSVYAHRVFQNI